jgi:hypothetical protein
VLINLTCILFIGGMNTFGEAWSNRFWNRHNLPLRSATTKMREAPADLAAKDEAYVRVGARLILQHNIPPELVIGADETNTLFVSRASKTRAKKGTKKVRLLGVDKDKAQITVTISGTETGDILPTQYIFGGKTTRCEPAQPPPLGTGYFDHTESHWQTPASFRRYIDRIFIPYKDAAIARLGLSKDRWSMLKVFIYSYF